MAPPADPSNAAGFLAGSGPAPSSTAVPRAAVSSKAVPLTAITEVSDGSGRFVLRRHDSSTFFTRSGLSFSLSAPASGAQHMASRWGIHMNVVGARDGDLRPEAERGARIRRWAGAARGKELRTYARLVWEEIARGVDMVAEDAPGGVDYRFVLSPGSDLAALKTRWEGATAVQVVDRGRGLDVLTDLGVLRVRGLRAFVLHGGARRELPARHVVAGDEVSVQVDGWDGRDPLVIDPTIAWSSYLGGGGSETGTAIALDPSGSVFVAGTTDSSDFPSVGGFDSTFGGTRDGFVTKVSAAGALLWSTYLGGSSSDHGLALAADASGNAYVTGYTSSSDFPIVSGFDATLGGTYDAFVAKLSGAGELVWSSFLGGSGTDGGAGVAVDATTGDVLVAGTSDSTDFPASGSFAITNAGFQDAFVARLSAAGALKWATYLGGSDSDSASAVAVDATGAAVVVGTARSTNFPRLGAFDTTLTGAQDAFVTRFTAAGALSWSTFLGGSDQTDYARRVAIDASGNAYVVGWTGSTDFPTTSGFDTANTNQKTDATLTKISAAGSLVWSSYLGGSGEESAAGVGVDGAGDVYVSGRTSSGDFPLLGAFATTVSLSVTGFVTKVSGAGALRWSTALVGGALDPALAVDAAGTVFLAGFTNASTLPTAGGFDTTRGGTQDAFVMVLTPAVGANGAACTNGSTCISAYCVDGVCCDRACTGACESCSAAKRGGGLDGTCGPTADGTDPEQNCAPQTCSGSTVTKARMCDGASACRDDGTSSCGLYVCATTSCRTTCSGDAQCGALAFCQATSCVADLELGTACDRAAQCKSGFCIDGVCCETSCTGGCDACSAAKKGSGTDGTCGFVAADTDPRDACAPGAGLCPADGTCDGAGACRSFAKAGTPCGTTVCAVGSVSGKICKGDSATCIDSPGVTCAPYACDAAACRTNCATDGDCAADSYCTAAGTCAARSTLGVACNGGRECVSGLCVDGVCCNGVCRGVCESCNEPGATGTCAAVVGSPRGSRSPCGALGDSDCGKTTCDGKVRDKCAGYANGPTVVCGEQTCTAEKRTLRKGTCDGAGSCAMPAPVPCTPYACDAASASGCKSACATQQDCADGYSCNGGSCVQGASCSADATASIDASGSATRCAPYRCGTSGRCQTQCASSSDCADGHVCDLGTKICVEAAAGSTESEGGCSLSRGAARDVPAWLPLAGLGALLLGSRSKGRRRDGRK